MTLNYTLVTLMFYLKYNVTKCDRFEVTLGRQKTVITNSNLGSENLN